MNAALEEVKKKKAAGPHEETAAHKNKTEVDHTASITKKNSVTVSDNRSISTKTQRGRALELLKIAPRTIYPLRKKGISYLAQCLTELKSAGHNIVSSVVNTVVFDGYTHVGAAIYSLAPTGSDDVLGRKVA